MSDAIVEIDSIHTRDKRERTAPDRNSSDSAGTGTIRRANVTGDVDVLLEPAPVFRSRLHGYDPFEVQNYVAWAESEIRASQRSNAHLAAQLGQSVSELRAAERRIERSERSGGAPDMTPIAERLRSILQLAVDEAAGIRKAAEAEADHVRARGIRDAAATRQRGRRDVEEMLEVATAKRRQLDLQAARDREAQAQAAAKRIAELEDAATARRRAADAEAQQQGANARRELAGLEKSYQQVLAALRTLEVEIGSALSFTTGTTGAKRQAAS